MKRTLALILTAAMLALTLAACAKAAPAATEAPKAEEPKAEAPAPTEAPKAEEPAPAEVEEEEEDYTTGDASLDDPRNADGIGEKELLVVSFGTSFNDSRRLTIGAIEQTLAEKFPDWSVRRAFTSQIIIDRVAKRDGEIIDNVHDALERAVANGVKYLVVQPTHLMDGYEYTDLRDELAGYADAFEQIALAEPLLKIDRDFDMVAETVVDATAAYDDGETAIVFMGHGTEAASNGVYAKMQTVLSEAGCENYFVGTVEAEPSLDDVLKPVQAGSYKRVVLRPLMIVAGDHANNDMAGDDPDSWKSVFEAAGYEVECVLEGLGQLPMVRRLIVEHTAEAMAKVGFEVNWG
ncbi:MAG: sirohydrochlorin cobaltochelatase [Oscillospiraceae bacterium]|nr:sirohydrochlorin cobaltochelatase [Oscillospiraceae bacterium]